jgi:hypothetical protein
MQLDQEQIRMLALAEQERDSEKLLRLIGEALERFEDTRQCGSEDQASS